MLKADFFDQILKQYHHKKYLFSDPLEFAYHYKDPWDQEAVALVSALLAYGNVKQIRRSIEGVLSRISELSPSPTLFVKNLKSAAFEKKAEQKFSNFTHRFNVGRDLIVLFKLLSKSWREYGSLGGHFLLKMTPDDLTIENPLHELIQDWRGWAGVHVKSSFSYLLTSPKDGSTCKRWCMLLRWFGRKDEVDLGLWTQEILYTGYSGLARTFPKGKFLKSSQLVIPLDTHTGRISQRLGLTRRKSLNWLAALEVTEALKKFNREDPVVYDFALSRMGILG